MKNYSSSYGFSSKPAPRRRKVASRAYVKQAIKASKEVNEELITITGSPSSTPVIVDCTPCNLTSGAKINPKAITVRYRLTSSQVNEVPVRCVIVQWYGDSTNDTISAAKIFQRGGTTEDITRPFLFAGRDNSIKFKVLSDKVYVLGATDSKEGHSQKMVKTTIYPARLGRKRVLGTGANAGFNKVYLMMTAADAPGGAGPAAEGFGVHEFYQESN